jgi:hypothetical protein
MTPDRGRPTWATVLDLLSELSSTKAPITGPGGRVYRVERFERDWRVMVVGAGSSRWVDLEDIHGCWQTFERLGRIESEDVLDPGRCSTFMMAMFLQVPGIDETAGAALSFA